MKKIKLINFEVNDILLLEEVLNKHLSKGWVVSTMNKYLIIFDKKKVNFNYYLVTLNELNNDNRESIKFFEQFGVDYQFSNKMFHVFSSKEKVSLYQKDETIRIAKPWAKNSILDRVLSLIIIFFCLRILINQPYFNLNTIGSFQYFVILFFILALLYLIVTIYEHILLYRRSILVRSRFISSITNPIFGTLRLFTIIFLIYTLISYYLGNKEFFGIF